MTSRLVITLAIGTPIAENVSASWHAQVTNALRACKNEATGPEIVRLTKMLTRLQAAAESALTQAHDATGKTSSSFTQLLVALSHG
jgi:hypothetical protein